MFFHKTIFQKRQNVKKMQKIIHNGRESWLLSPEEKKQFDSQTIFIQQIKAKFGTDEKVDGDAI